MNNISKKNEETSMPSNLSVEENESVKEVIKASTKKAEKPLMRYFDLLEDSSPSYVLGYN